MALSGTGAMIQYTTSTGGTLANVGNNSMTQWTMNIDAGLIETNGFGSTWKLHIAGLRGGSFALTGFWDVSGTTQQKNIQNSILNGTKSKIALLVSDSANDGYTGECWISGMQVQAQVDGAVGFSIDGMFDGAVSYSTAL